ncbi:hypothetical protein L6164_032620 [Bauhinia variegata]|uniref:Uncharacterized protein n=1 Tax=Bauhinia variegata TaxID=167791 RepID=A0ACB9KPM1_BAUVA|nr:hypothetical protein L6164_032620 [Bauhinia variegata]
MELLKGVSESVGLEPNYFSKALDLDSGLGRFIANLYPPCPQPELTMGIHPHTDPGFLTILIENGISGLQFLHNGKWWRVYAPPNELMVNIADQLEVLTNGKYKGAIHRATLYGKAMATRMSLAIAYGPCPDKVIRPASEFVNESHPPAYTALTYGECYELHLANAYSKITSLDYVLIQN